MFAMILLCAGLSSRFGSPKALVNWHSKALVTHVLESLVSTNIDEIIVVLGASHSEIKPHLLNHNRIKVVYNKDYKFGQTSSLKCGLQAISPSVNVFGLLPIDFPLIKASSINGLIKEFRQKTPKILIPTYENKKGHPPFFQVSFKEEILQLSNDLGLNTIIHRHEKVTRLLAVNDKGVILSFNTPEELKSLRDKVI